MLNIYVIKYKNSVAIPLLPLKISTCNGNAISIFRFIFQIEISSFDRVEQMSVCVCIFHRDFHILLLFLL